MSKPLLHCALPALLLLTSPGLLPAQERPNIVLIVADDLGYGDVACYGSKRNLTPNIDRLAAGGVRFTDFHSAGPMCSPTRAAMLTGLYQQRFGPQFDSALSGKNDPDIGLPLAAVTLAEALKGRGYATVCFGKWHLGYQPPWLPVGQGFDLFRGLASGDGDHHTHISRWGQEDWWHNNQLEKETGYTADLLTRHSVEFIERHQAEPFFLYVPHLAIHFPWQGPHDPPHRQAGKNYEADKWGVIPQPGNVSLHVKAMVESLDHSVGQIVAALARHRLERRTIVIFTSDNGGYLNYGKTFQNISSNGPLRGQKGNLYEGGHRVPMIVNWPQTIRPATSPATAHSVDLMPTLLALAGVAEPPATDGIDLTPHLLRGAPLPERMLFWRKGTEAAVRSGSWKLRRAGDQAELYNLQTDLAEQHDLAQQHPARVQQLQSAWGVWETAVNRSAEEFARP